MICVEMSFHQVYAHKIDKYNEVLQNRVYTLIYTSSYESSGDGFNNEAIMGSKDKESEVIVVCNGEDEYIETPIISIPNYSEWSCILKTNGKAYGFNKHLEKGKYRLDKQAGEVINYKEIENFGDSYETPLINMIKLKDGVEKDWDGNWKNYNYRKEFVAEGINSLGYNYEDYKVYIYNNIHMIVRFIFDGDKLIEINGLQADEIMDEQGNKISYSNKTNVKIKEFTDVADEKYLKLPDGMKIITEGDFR